MANVNFFSPDGGTTRYPIEDTEARSRIAGQQSLLKDTVGWTGKNLCNIKKGSLDTVVHQYPFALNGITFNMLEDGRLSITGTSTSLTFLAFNLISKGFTVGQKLKLSGVTSGDYENKCSLSIRYNSENIVVGDPNTHGETLITLTQEAINADDLHVTLRIPNNATVNEIVSPMVRKADITDPTYELYHESVEEEIEQIYADNGVLGAKNLLKYTATTQTINGVTFTVNEDKSITVNGTATADATFTLLADYVGLEKGVYKITGCPTGGTATTYEIFTAVRHLDATATEFVRDFGNGASLTVDNNTRNIALSIIVRNNTAVSNIVFKPMIRLASDPDDTYQPYTMTNRELTEKKIDAELTFVTGVSVDTLTENKRYYCSGGMTGLPTGNIGYLDVHRASGGDGIHQTFYPAGTQGEIYVRRYWDNAWGSWYKFTGTVVS